MLIEIGVSHKLRRHAMAWLVAAAIGMAPAVAQTADSEAPGIKDVPVQALLKRIEELEASQRQMQQKIDQLTGPTHPHSAARARRPPRPGGGTNMRIMSSDDDHVTALGPLKLQAFGDFDFGRPWFEKSPPGGLAGTTNSFTVGDFDLFTNTRISDHCNRIGRAADHVGLHQLDIHRNRPDAADL